MSLKCFECNGPDCENEAYLSAGKICTDAYACYTTWILDNINGAEYKNFKRGCLTRGIKEERYTDKIWENCKSVKHDQVQDEDHCARKCYDEDLCNGIKNDPNQIAEVFSDMAGVFGNPIFHGFLVFVVITIIILCAYLACTRQSPCCCEDDEYEDEDFYHEDNDYNRQDQFMETPKFRIGEDFQGQNTMPMDQQQQLMAQQMVPQQMVQHQMVAQPGSVNGMSPHPSMVANQNHIQLDHQNFLAQQLMARNVINSMANSPGQSVQNMAHQNISHGVYSPQQTPQSPQAQQQHQNHQQHQNQQQHHQQTQDVIMPQSQNILEKEAELDQEHENLMSRNNINVMNPDLGAPLQSPIVMNNKPSILKATAVRSQNSLYHGSQRNLRGSNQRGHMSMNQMNLNATNQY